MKNRPKGFNIEFVEHMGYYIPKSDVEGFNPDTYGWDSPVVDEIGVCWDATCQKLGYCRLKNEGYNAKD